MSKPRYELTSSSEEIAKNLADQGHGIVDNPDVAEDLVRELLKRGHEPDEETFFREDVDRRGKKKKVVYTLGEIQICYTQGIRYLP